MTSSNLVVFLNRCLRATGLPVAFVAIFLMTCIHTTALAVDVDLAVERELLTRLLADGHYRQAIAESERLEKALKPRRKDGEYLGRAAATVEMLIYRGIMQTRMGDLKAAEDTLQAAYRQLNDRDFQTRIAFAQRSSAGDAKAIAAYAQVLALELTDAASQLLVDRIRRANQYFRVTLRSTGSVSQANGETSNSTLTMPAQAQVDAVESWITRLDKLTAETLNARAQLDKVLSGVPAEVSASSRFKALKSESRPRMYAALRALEVSKLPWTVADASSPGDEEAANPAEETHPETVAERKVASARQLQRALILLAQADDDLESAIGAADLPTAPATAPPSDEQSAGPVVPHKTTGTLTTALAQEATSDSAADAKTATEAERDKKEAAILHADLLEAFAETHFLAGDIQASREDIDASLYLRNLARGTEHPELARGSILSAEIAMIEAEEARRDREPRLSREKAEQAVAAIELAQEILDSPASEFAKDAPLHDVLQHLLSKSIESQTTSSEAVAARDAADAAATRALAAIRSQEAASQSAQRQTEEEQSETSED